MKAKALISSLALGLLTLAILTVPVLASNTVTLTLTLPTGETLYTATWTDVEDLTLTVPEPLYLLIYTKYGTDTFTTPFELSFFVPMAGYCNLTVISEPEELTVTFEPMNPDFPDVVPDGVIDLYDLVTIARSLTVNVGPPENYDVFLDLNFDLTIDIFDLVNVAKHIVITT